MPSIVSDSIKYAYKKNQILKGLSFSIVGGEITYLAGLNGSGKTTWIKLASQLLKKQDGDILFNGKPFSIERDNTSIVFDTPPIYPKLSCYDNLYVLYQVNAKSGKSMEFLRGMGFSHELLKGKSGNLSLGQRHRLGIAGALLREPKYLILDEPDLGLDPNSWDVVSNCLLDMKNRGTAIMLTGQNFPKYDVLIDKIVVLSNGITEFEGTPNDLKRKVDNTSDEIDLKSAFDRIIRGVI